MSAERAVFVSPHLDDAVLSCGGGIARLVGAGLPVTVVTVFTGDQALGEPLSTLARRSHASWGAGDQPFSARRVEDLAALAVLGAGHEHLGLLDAVYRRSSSGEALYAGPLVPPARDDIERLLPQLVAALQASAALATPGARVFCPAGTGGHVDHLLVRMAVEQLSEPDAVVYFDEYPYSVRSDAFGASSIGPHGREPFTLALTARELEARIEAVGAYGSQLRGLFPSESDRWREIASARIPVVGKWFVGAPDVQASRGRMGARVRRDMEQLGGERYWWSAAAGSPFPSA